MAIPSDYNIQKKTTEKMSKFVDLQIGWQRMWNKNVEVVLFIIDKLGLGEKNLKKHLRGKPA